MTRHARRIAHPLRPLPGRVREGRTRVLATSLAALAALAGCAGLPVTTDYDPAFAFGSLRRFAFLPPPTGSDAARRHASLSDQRVRAALRDTLRARGFEPAPPGEADFFVVHHLATETGLDVRTVHTTHGYRRRGWGATTNSHTTVREYERGTLVIDVVLPAERRLVWRGSASARLSQRSDPARRDARIRDAVEQILKRFPPGS